MGTTVNLGLPTNNSTTDRQKKFLTYTMEQDGNVSSANTIIDAWAGTVNQKITALENNKPTILLKPQWVSVGYYEVTTSEISEFKVDMLITVKLNKDNDGTLTMKVNELPIKSLLKYDTTGTLVNLSVGDLRKDREYQFRYDGTSFVWQGGTSADQLNIVGTVGNIVGIKSDNTVADSGVSASQVTTNKNNITSLQTNKIDKTQIKNTLTETTSGNVLDATQGKILNDAIGLKLAKTDVINTTTQSATGKALDATQNNESIDGTLANKIKVLQTSDATQTQQINDCDKKIPDKLDSVDVIEYFKTQTQGVSAYCKNTCTNLPTTNFYLVKSFVTGSGDKFLLATEFGTNGTNMTGALYFCTIWNGVFGGWQQIATTTKTTLAYSSLLNGFVNAEGTATSAKINNICTFSAIFKNTVVSPSGTSIVVLNEAFRPSIPIPIRIFSKSTTPTFHCMGWFHSDGRIYNVDVPLQANTNYMISETYII